MIEFAVQNIPSLAFRKRSEEEMKVISTAMALLSSLIADTDLITDWLYFAQITKDAESSGVPEWALTLQFVSCICGSLAWFTIASDGRALD